MADLVVAWIAGIGLSAGAIGPTVRASQAAAATQPPAKTEAVPPIASTSTPAAGFAGDDTCTACHESEGTVYEHATKVGTGLDMTDLVADGEQPTLRQYDIASKDSDRFSAIAQLIPVSSFSVNLLAAIGTENFPDTNVTNGFGLYKDDSHTYSVGFDYVPTRTVAVAANYEYDKFTPYTAQTVFARLSYLW
jgi:Putative outer membrane beta-barrel porin, MtrB/PioB